MVGGLLRTHWREGLRWVGIRRKTLLGDGESQPFSSFLCTAEAFCLEMVGIKSGSVLTKTIDS